MNSAPFKRGETEVQIFWQGKAQNSSPILRCTLLARRSAKLIANFSATMVTSLPSFSLSLSLSLPLCISLSHRMYLTHNIGSASALPIIGSASALPIITRSTSQYTSILEFLLVLQELTNNTKINRLRKFSGFKAAACVNRVCLKYLF